MSRPFLQTLAPARPRSTFYRYAVVASPSPGGSVVYLELGPWADAGDGRVEFTVTRVVTAGAVTRLLKI